MFSLRTRGKKVAEPNQPAAAFFLRHASRPSGFVALIRQ